MQAHMERQQLSKTFYQRVLGMEPSLHVDDD